MLSLPSEYNAPKPLPTPCPKTLTCPPHNPPIGTWRRGNGSTSASRPSREGPREGWERGPAGPLRGTERKERPASARVARGGAGGRGGPPLAAGFGPAPPKRCQPLPCKLGPAGSGPLQRRSCAPHTGGEPAEERPSRINGAPPPSRHAAPVAAARGERGGPKEVRPDNGRGGPPRRVAHGSRGKREKSGLLFARYASRPSPPSSDW
jgi:hypothetical protein